MQISVVTPAYKCSECIQELYKRLIKTFENMKIDDFEIIYVNDGSPDNDWEEIEKICKKDKKVKGINLSRNFGQHKAITAGLDFAEGEWVVVMDCDLQDQPEEIEKLYSKAMEGYDVVFGRRYDRKDSFFKKTTSKIFFKIFDYFAETKTDPYTNTFGIFAKNVIESYKKMNESTRSFTLFIRWLGFRQINIDVEHSNRFKGKSSYNLKKMILLSLDYILIYSNKPLRISIHFGFFISFSSFIYGIYILLRKILFNISIDGWTSLIVSIYFLGGLIFTNLGLMGIYIGRIFDETKKRPIYIIREILN